MELQIVVIPFILLSSGFGSASVFSASQAKRKGDCIKGEKSFNYYFIFKGML